MGYVDEPDGSVLVAAGDTARWALNLLDQPRVDVEIGERAFVVPGSRQMLSCRRMPPGRDPHNLAFAASAGAGGRTPAPNHR